jgi:hypothetical protein
MKFTSAFERGRGTKTLGVAAVASVLAVPVVAMAQVEAPPPGKPAAAATPVPPTAAQLEDWRKAMRSKPQPNGCFAATYPETTFRQIPCRPPVPTKLYLPRQAGTTRLDQVGGNGIDFVATANPGSSNSISQATGSFPATPSIGPSTTNYSVQLNTNYFLSPTACTGSQPLPPNTGLTNLCQGQCCAWQQFVYSPQIGGSSSSTPGGYIQYWIINYGPQGTQCPLPAGANCAAGAGYDGWCPVDLPTTGATPAVQCVINGAPVSANSAPLTQLSQVQVAAFAPGVNGPQDFINIFVGGNMTGGMGNGEFPELSTNWATAEFNVFGNGGGSQLSFNPGSTVNVQTDLTFSGTQSSPGCQLTSFTQESNNLTLTDSPPVPPQPPPTPWLTFSESNSGPGGSPACIGGTSMGETHLTTFNGLLYNFQATGDFLLAETGPEFSVQTRQVSAAPTWPNVAFNSAVAVQAGKNRVAICLPGPRILVDSKSVVIPPNHGQLNLSDGGIVSREEDNYYVFAPTGDSVHAALAGPYINVSVGLGRWPSKVRGLLANANGKVNEIEDSEGQVLTIPLSFSTLYGHFTDSWRVPANQSMLSICGASDLRGIPEKPFFANDLSPELAESSRTICTQAGVKGGPLLDACMIDVAVLGRGAAQAFAHMPAPVAVGDTR